MLDPKLEAFLANAPIFLQPWWLEAVAPGQWDYVVVKRGEEIAAAMPYVLKKTLGVREVIVPPKTPYLGPWLRPSLAKYPKRLGEEKDLLEALIDQFPAYADFRQSFHPGVRNWLAFCWRGFRVEMRITYQFPETNDLDALWKGTLENVRTDVKKARKSLVIEEGHAPGDVVDLHRMTCRRQGFEFVYTKEEMETLYAACRKRDCARTLLARDAEGNLHSGAIFVWDRSNVYYYFSGANPELRSSGAGSLVIWSGIELASTLGRAFDFEGSMVEPIERAFRAFGAQQVMYPVLLHRPRPGVVGLLNAARQIKQRIMP